MNNAEQTISKIDAARRQLCTAIKMFFSREDPVAIHTVCWAAHMVLRTLAKKKGRGSIILDSNLIPEEMEKKFYKLMSRHSNFFKHADRDYEQTIQYDPIMVQFWLFDACHMFEIITKARTIEIIAFTCWFALAYPEFVIDGPMKTVLNQYKHIGLDFNDFETISIVIDPSKRSQNGMNMPPNLIGLIPIPDA